MSTSVRKAITGILMNAVSKSSVKILKTHVSSIVATVSGSSSPSILDQSQFSLLPYFTPELAPVCVFRVSMLFLQYVGSTNLIWSEPMIRQWRLIKHSPTMDQLLYPKTACCKVQDLLSYSRNKCCVDENVRRMFKIGLILLFL